MSPASYQTAPPRVVVDLTPWPRPFGPFVSGKRDSNPRPQPWQGCALPTELFPQRQTPFYNVFPSHGGEGNRTPDLLNAIQALSQLSYTPGGPAAICVPLAGNREGYPRVESKSRNCSGFLRRGRYFAARFSRRL